MIGLPILIVLVILFARRRGTARFGIPDNLSSATKRKYLLEDVAMIESLCPSEFLQSQKATQNRMWIRLLLFVLPGSILVFVLTANRIRVLGWNLTDLLWGIGLAGGLVYLCVAAIRFFETHANRLDLGENPLHRTSQQGAMRAIGVLITVSSGMMIFLFFNGKNDPKELLNAFTQFQIGLAMFLTTPRIILTEDGILTNRVRYTWDKITWYRWYDHREGVLVGLDPSSVIHPLMVLPATEETAPELDEFLERFAPDKCLDDIHTDDSEMSPSAAGTTV